MEVSGQPSAPAAIPPGKEPTTLTAQGVVWNQESVWTVWWRDKFFAPTVNRTPDSAVSSFVIVLYRLRYAGAVGGVGWGVGGRSSGWPRSAKNYCGEPPQDKSQERIVIQTLNSCLKRKYCT